MNEPLNHVTATVTEQEPAANERFYKPRRLIEHATENPLYVLEEVFKGEHLASLKDNIKDWFHLALVNENGYHEEDERAGLLVFYQDIVPLVEALFIIHKQRQPDKPETYYEKLTEDELRNFKNRDRVTLLTAEQEANPFKVINGFCKKFTRQYTERELWNWLEAGISFAGTYPENLCESSVLNLYENIQCLTAAAYELAKPALYVAGSGAKVNVQDDPVLERVVSIIAITCKPDKIYLLHSMPNSVNKAFNVLVLLSGTPPKSFKEYQDAIKEACKELAIIECSINKTTEVLKHLQAGHLFYSVVCKPGKLIYDNTQDDLPVLQKLNVITITQNAVKIFEPEIAKAKAFYQGAVYYYGQLEKNMAVFMLHQTAERCMIGLLITLTGHNYFTHNLYSLLRRCLTFTNGLQAAFPDNNTKERELLELLNQAYTRTRYRNDYYISDEDVKTLIERTGTLIEATEQAVNEQLIAFKKLFQ